MICWRDLPPWWIVITRKFRKQSCPTWHPHASPHAKGQLLVWVSEMHTIWVRSAHSDPPLFFPKGYLSISTPEKLFGDLVTYILSTIEKSKKADHIRTLISVIGAIRLEPVNRTISPNLSILQSFCRLSLGEILGRQRNYSPVGKVSTWWPVWERWWTAGKLFPGADNSCSP